MKVGTKCRLSLVPIFIENPHERFALMGIHDETFRWLGPSLWDGPNLAIFIENGKENYIISRMDSRYGLQQMVQWVRFKLTPSVPYYTLQIPNADTIVSILPFLLFGILLFTAFFVTYISYQRILFLPDMNEEKPFSWSSAL